MVKNMRQKEFMVVYCIYNTVFYGLLVITSIHIYFGNCLLQRLRKGNISQNTTIILVCKMSKNCEKIREKNEFMMVYCIYGSVFYGLIGHNMSSCIF